MVECKPDCFGEMGAPVTDELFVLGWGYLLESGRRSDRLPMMDVQRLCYLGTSIRQRWCNNHRLKVCALRDMDTSAVSGKGSWTAAIFWLVCSNEHLTAIAECIMLLNRLMMVKVVGGGQRTLSAHQLKPLWRFSWHDAGAAPALD